MRVRVAVSFNGFRAGEEADTEPGGIVDAYVRAGLMEVVDSGEHPAGPGEHPEIDPEREHERTAAGGTAGGEQSQDPVPSRHRKTARVDPG